MSAPPWNFEGYVTAAGNRIVQDWFWNEANDEERGALRDRANYLANLKKTLWMEPYFKWFGKQGYRGNSKTCSKRRVKGIRNLRR